MKEKPLTEFMSRTKKEKEKPAEPKVSGLKGPWELPEGWRWVRLESILSEPLQNGYSPKPAEEVTGRWILSLSSLSTIEIKNRSSNLKPAPRDSKVNEFLLQPGDILISRANTKELVGLASIYTGIPENCIYPDLMVRIRVKNQIDRRFLVYWLRSPYIRAYFADNAKGTSQSMAKINQRVLKKTPIPLPPLSEQKRIVAKLDEVSERLEEAKRLAREAREEAERLMASALHEVFSKAEEKGWKWVRLGDIVTRRNETIDPTQNPDLPFVGLEHIMPGEAKLSRYSSTADLKSQKYVFYPGDVLYGKLRPYLDKAVVATIKGMCSTDLLVLTPKEGLMPEYLVTFMHTPQFRQLATQYMRGTNHPRISWKSLQKFKIPLPPLEEQKRIVAYLDSIRECAQRLVKLYEEREKELERLFPAILDRAFRGDV